MTIRFTCRNPQCGKAINAPDTAAGRRVRCPACGQVLTVPKAADTYDLADEDRQPQRQEGPPPAAPTEAENTCAVCGAVYPRGSTCPRCHTSRSKAAGGGFDKGKWITIAAVVGLFALLMTGAYFVIKMFAQTGEQYGHALIGARERAGDVGCALQLTNIYRSLETAALAADGKYPDSITELYSLSAFHCPARDGPAYQYIPGQDRSMPPDNVLVYETAAAHEGRCSVLRLSGAVELLTPQEVQTAVAETQRVLEAKAKK
jgi:hypothetical protein